MTIETKYNVGDEVWWVKANTVKTGKVLWIDCCLKIYKKEVVQSEYYYISKPFNVVACGIHGSDLFPSKQALLDSL